MSARCTSGVFVGLLAVMVGSAVVIGSVSARRVAVAGGDEARLRGLLADRHAVLRQLASQATKAYEAGLVTSEQLYVANVAVLRAELELRTTDVERLDVLQRWVTAARAQEQATRLAVESGRAPSRALLTSKVDRLDAEIALERAASE